MASRYSHHQQRDETAESDGYAVLPRPNYHHRMLCHIDQTRFFNTSQLFSHQNRHDRLGPLSAVQPGHTI